MDSTGKSGQIVRLLVLDEIHKEKKWKQTLQGVYDTRDRPADILVTGSARLSTYGKGSDSLMGRYYHFRIVLGEIEPTIWRVIQMPHKSKDTIIGIPDDDSFDLEIMPGWEFPIAEHFTEHDNVKFWDLKKRWKMGFSNK